MQLRHVDGPARDHRADAVRARGQHHVLRPAEDRGARAARVAPLPPRSGAAEEHGEDDHRRLVQMERQVPHRPVVLGGQPVVDLLVDRVGAGLDAARVGQGRFVDAAVGVVVLLLEPDGDLALRLRVADHDPAPVLAVGAGRPADRGVEDRPQHVFGNRIGLEAADRSRRVDRLEGADRGFVCHRSLLAWSLCVRSRPGGAAAPGFPATRPRRRGGRSPSSRGCRAPRLRGRAAPAARASSP